MPTATFYKLPDKKRRKIIEESYKEFSLHSYEAASITNLVKSLGIAKGSVYQYFTDKADLYSYLVNDASLKLNKLLDQTCPYKGENFYDWYLKLLIVEVKFLLSFPAYAVMFSRVSHGINNLDKQLAETLSNQKKTRINRALPVELYNSSINTQLLIRSSINIFELFSSKIEIGATILANEPINVDSKTLLTTCSEWVQKLKQGL